MRLANALDGALAVLMVVGLWVIAMMWGGSIESQNMVERCDNYGSFIYQDVRYTCEKVEGELK